MSGNEGGMYDAMREFKRSRDTRDAEIREQHLEDSDRAIMRLSGELSQANDKIVRLTRLNVLLFFLLIIAAAGLVIAGRELNWF